MQSVCVIKAKNALVEFAKIEESIKIAKLIEVEEFFCFDTYLSIKEAKESSIPVLGIFKSVESDCLGLFLDIALKKNGDSVGGGGINLYYYPKPHKYYQADNICLFFLQKDITLEKFLIEILYRSGTIPVETRNAIHRTITEKLGFKKQRITLCGRELSNLSNSWILFENNAMCKRHLIERIRDFYPAPVHINLGTTNLCNLRCSFCHFFAPKYVKTHVTDFFKKQRLLDDKIVYAVLDYAAKHNCVVDLVSPGEMLTDKRVPDFIRYGKDKGVRYLSMTTNGLLLDDEMGDRLLNSRLDALSISIDAAEEETYKKVRGGDFHRLIKNVERFLNKLEGKKVRMHISLSLILQESAKDEEKKFKEKWSKYPSVKELYIRNLVVKEEQGMKVSHDKNFDVGSRFLCQKPWDEIHINPDGGVMPCCTMSGTIGWDNKVLGNLYLQTLDEIWFGEVVQNMRKDLMELDFSKWKVCKQCEEWSYISIEKENGDIESPSINFMRVNE